MSTKRNWRGPTIAEVARQAGVGRATVDRVLNTRGSVRPSTEQRVLAALDHLKKPDRTAGPPIQECRIAFLSDSGASFNRALEEAVEAVDAATLGVECSLHSELTAGVDPDAFAATIERTAERADALVLVARESPVINRALLSVASRNVPIVCLTTDLPNSGRAIYVGNDQTAAGSTAACLMGRLLASRSGKILLVCSAPYRVQEERELGFRRVLRLEFPHLEVDNRVYSNDDTAYAFRHVSQYIDEHGPPAGIYNVGGGNVGIGRALEEHELLGKTVFIGYELNPNSRALLESGHMDIVIGHDVENEVALSISWILAHLARESPPSIAPTKIQIFTKYNCG